MTMAMMMAMERMAKMMKTTIMMTMMLLMIKIISDGDRQLERRPASYSLSPIKTLASPGAEHGCDDDDGFNDADDADNIDGDILVLVMMRKILRILNIFIILIEQSKALEPRAKSLKKRKLLSKKI